MVEVTSNRPRCYNRPAYRDATSGWMNTGRKVDRPAPPWFRFKYSRTGVIEKRVLRYRWPWFEDRCASWDGPRTLDTVPAREHWACSGCRWLPEAAFPYFYPVVFHE